MCEQGRSTLAVGEDGRILDRLAGLEKVISPDVVRGVLQATERINGRACELTHEVMLWVVLAMGLFTHLPIRQVFRHSRRLRAGEKCPARSSLCEARKRLGVEPVQALHAVVVRPLATADTPGAFYRRWRLMGLDGTVMDVPDSAANAGFGRSSGARGEGPFPQARKVSLVELGTHVETALAIGGWGDDERTLARTLWDQIPGDALLLEDRGFFSYDDWKSLESRVKLLVRVKSNFVLRPLQRLADGSYLAKIYPASYYRDKDRHGIVVRVIEYTLDDPQRTGHGEVHRLITNLLDPAAAPARELIVLYHERWEEELVFDEQKTHHDPRRAEKPAQLRSETPNGVRQELYALSLGHFVIRALMLEAARPARLDVDRLSFVGCFRILQCRLPECPTPAESTQATLQAWYQALLAEMRTERIGPRRDRINPRVIKRKMSRWNKKRAAHRSVRPLLKTFEQSIVMKT
ncbi:MAG TPA: IS4 family transposase [Longimicrobiales bacterium]|nr:IS4 family transposase [Longimicrobiales bacterium]